MDARDADRPDVKITLPALYVRQNVHIFVRINTRRVRQVDGELCDSARAAAVWAPRSSYERVLELQLACVHPGVCLLAAAAGIGVPDPEDAMTPLSHKKARLVAEEGGGGRPWCHSHLAFIQL